MAASHASDDLVATGQRFTGVSILFNPRVIGAQRVYVRALF